MKKHILYTVLIVLCIVPVVTIAYIKVNAKNWWIDWLEKPDCPPPCWKGITPGKTSTDQAIEILVSLPNIMITYNGQHGIDWKFKKTFTDSGFLKSKDGVVNVIALGNSFENKLIIEQIIEEYGYPDFVIPYDCREEMCAVILLYPEFGMILDIFVPNSGNITTPMVLVKPKTVVETVILFPSGMESFNKIPDYQDGRQTIPWKGYGLYP